jgi:glycogen debranching enzyme
MSGASVTGDVERFGSSEIVKVTTPDPEANRAIEWAQIALEQSWTCNARLGCAVVAGYGPSHGSRRPQYAWYFAGDGLLATEALLHEGNYERAADELDFLYRYQNSEDGMMLHEISQSAGFLNWAKDYPYYLYVHVDITFDFLTVVAEYDRISGDVAFLSRHWPATLKAYQYCLSTLDKGDGLPRIPVDKISGNEQDHLTDELTLSAAWVKAAHAMSELAALMHDEALSRQAESASLRARKSIRSRYWDPTAHRWVSGFTPPGRRQKACPRRIWRLLLPALRHRSRHPQLWTCLRHQPISLLGDCAVSRPRLRITIRPDMRKGVCGATVRLGRPR